jgi:hypothetical protein
MRVPPPPPSPPPFRRPGPSRRAGAAAACPAQGRVGSRSCLIGPSFACPAQEKRKPLCFYFPALRCGSSRLPLFVAPALGQSLQRHRFPLLPVLPPGIGGGGGVGGSGERGRRWGGGGGMRASDIGGVCGPAATLAPGPSQQRHRLPLLPLPAPLPGIGCCSSIDNILQQNTAPGIHCRGSVVQAAAHYGQGTGFDTCQ